MKNNNNIKKRSTYWVVLEVLRYLLHLLQQTATRAKIKERKQL